jgi:indolepyruvate ferredoxin oxidoreductase beta subunit
MVLMKKQPHLRIFLTGVGGQGTLTATTLLANICLDQKIEVVSGEIHGMAQRGGVVESSVVLGGLKSPRIAHGEADIILGFEALETLRALPYLRPGGYVFASSDPMPPTPVSLGMAVMPSLEHIKKSVSAVAGKAWFFPIRTMGVELGAAQAGNTVLLGALAQSGLLGFGAGELIEGIKAHLPPKACELNIKAAQAGQKAFKAIAI